MNNLRRTTAWLQACNKNPHHHSLEERNNNLSVQIGCHLEEFTELLSALRTDSEGCDLLRHRVITDLAWWAGKLKKQEQFAYIPQHTRIDALDALCDCEVTGNGVAYLAGFNKQDADEAVLASNEAKLVNGTPVILQGGKIGKPEGWTPPDLRGFV